VPDSTVIEGPGAPSPSHRLSESISEIIERVTRGVDLSHRIGVKVAGLHFNLCTNEPALVDELRQYFDELSAEPVEKPDYNVLAIQTSEPKFDVGYADWPRDPGKVGRKEEFADVPGGRIVRKVRTGMHFLLGDPNAQVAIGPCTNNPNQIVNFINVQVIRHYLDEGWQLCHAAGVVSDGAGIQISATSGAGKSTLAMHLMTAGVSFTSNDRLFVRKGDAGAEMAGVPKWPRVNPGTLLNNPALVSLLDETRRRELQRLPLEQLWELEEKYDVPIRQVYGDGRVAFRAPLRFLILLNWSYKNDVAARFKEIVLSDRRDLLDLVMKNAGPLCVGDGGKTYGGPADLDPEEYVRQFEGVRVFEVTGQPDFALATQYCLELAGAAS
jgi:HprK-related kinase B